MALHVRAPGARTSHAADVPRLPRRLADRALDQPCGLRRGAPPRASQPGGTGEGGSEGGAELDARLLRKQLDSLFYSSGDSGDEAEKAAPQADAALPGCLYDLPLWRVQWAALPGLQAALHVHVPHYCDMFARLLAGPRPWRFGHLYMPGGSRSLGSEEYALAPGSRAPLVGTLMEVLQAVQFPDGRLLLLAVGRSRFKVVRPTQELPHARADAIVVPDLEEVAQQERLGARAASDALSGSDDVATAMASAQAAAQAAAAAATHAWLQYELSAGQVVESLALVDAGHEGLAREFGQRLVQIGSTSEVLEPPWAGSDPWLADMEPLVDAAIAAGAAAEAAAEAAARDLAPAGGAPAAAAGLLRACGLAEANSVRQRGVPAEAAPPEEAAGPAGEEGGQGGALAGALALERELWAELDAVGRLAARLGSKRPLPAGLLWLRPCADPPAGPAAEPQAHPAFPALRRLARLSFAACAVAPTISGSEGRQALLEAPSVAARLRVLLASVRKQRGVLAAIVALKQAAPEPGDERPGGD